MSPRPQNKVLRNDTPPVPGVDTDTGKRFVPLLSSKGPLVPTEIHNMSQFVKTFGVRQNWSIGYDDTENYFREGGARLIVSRVVGPTPVKAKKILLDGSAGQSLIVEANEYGDYANAWTIDVDVSGGNFTLFLAGIDPDGTVFTETLGPFATNTDAAAVDFTRATITQGASALDPAATSPAALSTGTAGTDDHDNVTPTQYVDAYAKFTKDWGPGQVSNPGATSATLHAPALAHCLEFNRVPILDGVNSATIASVTSPAATDRAVDGAEYAGMFWPSVTIPGLTPGTTRTVPPSGTVCGIIARNDGAGLSPNKAAAGDLGYSNWAVGLSQARPTNADWDTLADAGVNVLQIHGGRVQVYGFRTLANPATKPRWTMLTGSRLFLAVASLVNAALEHRIFGENTADLALIKAGHTDVVGVLQGFGQSIVDFNVDTDTVNDEETMAAGELNVAYTFSAAPFADAVTALATKVASNEAVAA